MSFSTDGQRRDDNNRSMLQYRDKKINLPRLSLKEHKEIKKFRQKKFLIELIPYGIICIIVLILLYLM